MLSLHRFLLGCLTLAAFAVPVHATAQASDAATAARNTPMPTSSATPSRYGLIGTMRTKPGQRDAVVKLLLRDVDDLRAVGCHLYVVGLDHEDPDLIRVTEVWDSKDAHRASLQLPGVRATIAEAMPLLTGEFTQTEFPVAGGLGLTE